jgi:hypothetical protein
MRSRARNKQGSVVTSVLLVPDRECYLFCSWCVYVGGELVVLMRDARGLGASRATWNCVSDSLRMQCG